MASLSEMMGYAQYVNEVQNPVASGISNVLQGIMAGVENNRKRRTAQLDVALKMLDIQEKQHKLKEDQQATEIESNFAKSFKMLPMNPAEHDNARGIAFNNLGDGKNPNIPNTQNGKIASMVFPNIAGYTYAPKYMGKGKFEIVPIPTRNPAKAGETDNQKATNRARVMKMATDAATNEAVQKAQSNLSPTDRMIFDSNKVKPTPDMINKYIPAFEAYISGDTPTYEKLIKKIGGTPKATPSPASEEDLSGLDDLNL